MTHPPLHSPSILTDTWHENTTSSLCPRLLTPLPEEPPHRSPCSFSSWTVAPLLDPLPRAASAVPVGGGEAGVGRDRKIELGREAGETLHPSPREPLLPSAPSSPCDGRSSVHASKASPRLTASVFSYVPLHDPKRTLCTILPPTRPEPPTLFLTKLEAAAPVAHTPALDPNPGVAGLPDAPEVGFSPEATVLPTLGKIHKNLLGKLYLFVLPCFLCMKTTQENH